MNLVEQGAKCPSAVYPLEWEDGAGTQFWHLGKVRSLAEFLALYVMVAAAGGKPEEAAHALELNFALARSFRHEPARSSQWTAASVSEHAAHWLEAILRLKPPSQQTAVRLFDRLGQLDLFTALADGLDADYVYTLWLFDSVKLGENQYWNVCIMKNFWYPDPPNWLTIPLTGPRAFTFTAWVLTRDERYQLAWLRQHQLGLRQGAAVPSQRPLALRKCELWPWYGYLSAASVIEAQHELLYFERVQTRLNAARCGLAVVAFQGRMGEDPASLAEVEKRLGWKLPLDPGSGKNFKLVREGKLLRVESVLTESAGQGKTRQISFSVPEL